MQLHALEPPFKMFYTFVGKKFSSCRLKFPGENCKQIHEKSKASVWRNVSTGMVPKICQNSRFKEIIYCNFSRDCLLVKMASKHLTGHSRLHKRKLP